MAVTWEETIAESRKEGEARGLVLASQTADLRAAKSRFGSLPPSFEEKIRAIQDLDQLGEILDQIVAARSITDIDPR